MHTSDTAFECFLQEVCRSPEGHTSLSRNSQWIHEVWKNAHISSNCENSRKPEEKSKKGTRVLTFFGQVLEPFWGPGWGQKRYNKWNKNGSQNSNPETARAWEKQMYRKNAGGGESPNHITEIKGGNFSLIRRPWRHDKAKKVFFERAKEHNTFCYGRPQTN